MTRVDAAVGNDPAMAHFESAVVPLMPALLAYFARRVLPSEDAADCLSETMIVLWRHRSRLPESDDARRAWTFGVARRVLSNQRRGRIRQLALADRVRAEVRLTLPPADRDDEVAAALETLPERDAELVRLIIWDGFGVSEAGALLGLRAGASRTRYSRAKEKLRALLPG